MFRCEISGHVLVYVTACVSKSADPRHRTPSCGQTQCFKTCLCSKLDFLMLHGNLTCQSTAFDDCYSFFDGTLDREIVRSLRFRYVKLHALTVCLSLHLAYIYIYILRRKAQNAEFGAVRRHKTLSII